MHRSIVLAVAFAAAGCAADRPEPITQPSKVSLFGGELEVDVTDDGTTTRFKVTQLTRRAYVRGGGGTTWEVKSANAAGWFIFPESAHKVWLYQGADRLTLIESIETPPEGASDLPGIKQWHVDLPPGQESTAAALDKAPKAVLERLPTSFWAAPRASRNAEPTDAKDSRASSIGVVGQVAASL